MRKLYVLIITAIYVLSCSPENTIIEGGEIIEVPPISSELITDLVDDFQVIRLEETDESMISYITNFRVADGKIYALDNLSSQKFLIFDKNGKFIKQIGHQGRGPSEYVKAGDFRIDYINHEIILEDVGDKKLLVYDMDGNYKRTVRFNTPFEDVAPLGSDRFVFGYTPSAYHFFDNDEIGDHKILICSENGDIIKKEYVNDLHMSFGIRVDNYINSNRDGSVTMSPQYSYGIFNVTYDDIKIAYSIKPDFKVITTEDIKLMDDKQFDAVEKEGKTFFGGTHAQTLNHIFLKFGFWDTSQAFYDKKTKKAIHIKDKLCGKYLTPDEEDYFWAYIDPVYIIMQVEGHVEKDSRKEMQQLIDMSNNAKNKVLIRYKLKDL